MDQAEFVIPSYDTLDPAHIDVFFDVDLDELTILFYGRNREHYVHPVNEVLSYMLDVDTDEVVGVALGQFTRRVLHEHPKMREVIPMSTVLIGDVAGTFDQITYLPKTVVGRVASAARAARQAWQHGSDKQPVRDIMNNLPVLALSV